MLGRRRWLASTALGALFVGGGARADVRGLPHVALGGLPTRVSAHAELAARLGLGSLHVKRDDEGGDVFGGSKARKLEHLLADARARGHRSVLTFGGAGSNHALATAIHARRLGLRAHLVLLPEPPSARVRAHLYAALDAGATLHAGTRAHRDDPSRAVADFAPRDAPYVIAPGGTSPLGTAGYVAAGLELAAQVAAGALPRPDVVYVAAGTTGTAAGLWIGLEAAGLATRLVAVRASGPGTASRARVAAEIEATQRLLRASGSSLAPTPLETRFVLEHRFAGDGYARPSAAGRAASATVGAELPLDPTYTEKAFAALIATAPRGAAVLFWHTFDARLPPAGAARARDLPAGLRGYARG
ncbi:MAG: pyridoxal-phosphate dependent enzyme [Sandaracinaceae bacterium]|nr:pyridoxal-phosphate dependent enzyme [Sandaracinaceae bacterium]